MKRMNIAGLCLVAVCATSAISVASASAALEFTATAMGSLAGSAMSNQIFTTSAGTVECTGLKLSAGEAELKASSQNATIKYEGCTAFGFVGAEISPAEYEFKINGEVKILKAITIKATSACTSTVPAQTVKTVKYINRIVGGKMVVEIETAVTGIESSGKGFLCEYATEKKGTYTGTSLVLLPSGNILA